MCSLLCVFLEHGVLLATRLLSGLRRGINSHVGHLCHTLWQDNITCNRKRTQDPSGSLRTIFSSMKRISFKGRGPRSFTVPVYVTASGSVNSFVIVNRS